MFFCLFEVVSFLLKKNEKNGEILSWGGKNYTLPPAGWRGVGNIFYILYNK